MPSSLPCGLPTSRLCVKKNDRERDQQAHRREYNSIFEAQALTYLRMRGLKLALVINFGGRVVRDGIHRVVVNGL
ncbi:MAG TPA: GxxExxY protein [Blastocatellia bacterium]|nr:GxxExxY protein [Blastocatellia bacterium]